MKKIPKNILKNGNSPIYDLNERSKEIFTLIVEDYVTNGEPVGSRKLSTKLQKNLSAASIRNVMSDLQDAGLLTSQHSSAVPRSHRFWDEVFCRRAFANKQSF